MKKLTLGLIFLIGFLFFQNDIANAELVKIDTSLDEHTGELHIDSGVIDLDSYIHESDSGLFTVQDYKLIPLNTGIPSFLRDITPFATTRRWYPNIGNGDTWSTNIAATTGQRITFGNKPRNSNVTYTREINIVSYYPNRIYYASTQYGARSEYSFNVRGSTNELFFMISHYSPTTGFYEAWVTG